jgi:OOP family OmpA-OmpF porin
MVVRILPIFGLWLTAGLLLAQDEPVLEFSTPSQVPNISSNAEEIYPLTAPDNSLYFVRAFHEQNKGGVQSGHDIWRAAGSQTPQEFMNATNKLKRWNGYENNAVVGISADGEKVWILSSYPVDSGRKFGLTTSENNDGKWTKPQPFDLPEIAFVGEFFGLHVAMDGEVVFLSMESTAAVGKEDIYVLYKNEGQWVGPLNIGVTVNSTKSEISPFYDPNNNILFFASDRPGGKGGMDIFYSFKTGEGWNEWSAPKRVEGDLNSDGFDAYLSCSPEGDCYFASNRDGNRSNIYYTRLTLTLPEAEEVIAMETEEEVTEVTEVEAPAEVKSVEETPPVADEVPAPPPVAPAPVTPAPAAPRTAEPSVAASEDLPVDATKMRTIRFGFEKIIPSGSDAFNVLEEVAALMKENEGITVHLSGHTCSIGSRQVNLYYSRARASRVQKELVRRGIDPARCEISFHAFDKPIESNATPSGRSQNRRVEITFSR